MSMVYNMSIQKEKYNSPFNPQIHQKRKRGENQQNFRNRDRNRSFSRDRINYRKNVRPIYRRKSQDREDYKQRNYAARGDSGDRGRVNYRRDFGNARHSSIDRNRSRMRERNLTPRRDDRRYQSPN